MIPNGKTNWKGSSSKGELPDSPIDDNHVPGLHDQEGQNELERITENDDVSIEEWA